MHSFFARLFDRGRTAATDRPRAGRPEAPAGRFIWSTRGSDGQVGYAVRQAVRARLGDVQATGAEWSTFLVDVDLDLTGGNWLRGSTVHDDPARGNWTPYIVPQDAVVHDVRRPADEATTTRMTAGTRLVYVGTFHDPTEGIGGGLFRILHGPFANDLVYLGTGGRYGAARWVAEAALVPGDVAQIRDLALLSDLLPLMQTVAIEHGALGYRR